MINIKMFKLKKKLESITKEEFNAYRKVQIEGKVNMFSPLAIKLSGLNKDTYLCIINNYTELKRKFEN